MPLVTPWTGYGTEIKYRNKPIRKIRRTNYLPLRKVDVCSMTFKGRSSDDDDDDDDDAFQASHDF